MKGFDFESKGVDHPLSTPVSQLIVSTNIAWESTMIPVMDPSLL